ncbi:hypothetical protein ACWT_0219 [Actinoplanes sp. SE50]|uniref:alpha/beta hydrolase n=1 Tax=unclassified Actinoplanes TaxID=2626549 RepID=UPI00023EBC7F|nr:MULTISPECIES: alpha/beta hydrolase [unclassified Actinoplanes]AEV81231.1 hypothetical protein ACPL_334 [Actinoplanes sp. SE50/110]ATO79634.1 hypothetical protein ACWT_0219 [Actinoplanes sp. SE50]SLL97037.1 acetoin dehydrogenase E2 subunit dihydrolipoyllysine-residue acetyltransferase [Actinoplanes sp. SE50/110]
MREQTLPPVRTSHLWRGLQGRWNYDMWGCNGRPVVLLPAVLFDRTMWWPLAAELRPYAAVIAIDLPGHGNSSDTRAHYAPSDLVDDLADLIYSVGIRRAPIIVGHASSTGLATLFATRYATHAVVTVDAGDQASPTPVDREQYLATMRLQDIPAEFQPLVQPSDNPALLAAYQPLLSGTAAQAPGAVTAALAVHSTSPSPGCFDTAPHRWQHHVYNRPGRFAQLSDMHRLSSDIQALL